MKPRNEEEIKKAEVLGHGHEDNVGESVTMANGTVATRCDA